MAADRGGERKIESFLLDLKDRCSIVSSFQIVKEEGIKSESVSGRSSLRAFRFDRFKLTSIKSFGRPTSRLVGSWIDISSSRHNGAIKTFLRAASRLKSKSHRLSPWSFFSVPRCRQEEQRNNTTPCCCCWEVHPSSWWIDDVKLIYRCLPLSHPK